MPALSDEQLSFTRYVRDHKRAAEARAREGAAYAFGPELRTRQRVGRMRPMVLALELGLAEFGKRGRAFLLEGAIAVGPTRFSGLLKVLQDAASALGVGVPRAFVSPTVKTHEACVFGTADDPLIVLPAVFVDHFSPLELQCTLASALGRIHNDHAPLLTVLWMLQFEDLTSLRWAAKPAALWLGSWAKGADLTADRAGLLVTRNIDGTVAALGKRLGAGQRLPAEPPVESDHLGVRTKALQLFRRTAFYQGGGSESPQPEALSIAECNEQAAALLGGR